MPPDNHSPNRRRFLQSSAATALAAGAAWQSTAAQGVHEGAGETLRIGLIGAGGRGGGAVVDAFQADPDCKLVAICDIFRDRAVQCRSQLLAQPDLRTRVEVPDDAIFADFDGYRGLVDADVDIVIMATPPHFRPAHLEYAVEKGKHCFVEKPIAVDAPGYHRVRQACQAATQKGLSIVSGLCYRYDPKIMETVARIRDGAIGDILSIESRYDTGTLWHRGDQPTWSRMEYQIRNWLYFTWLSGDHIVEQAVHSLDKTAWLLGDPSPVRAWGMGGRQQRIQPEFGNIYDHHGVTYEYPSGVRVYFTCRQMKDCTNYVDEWVVGTEGTARILGAEIRSRKDGHWKYSGPTPSMYVCEHEAFFRSIREGQPINNGPYMCNSTMLAILGRMCTYSGHEVAWDEAIGSQRALGPGSYAWTDIPTEPVAMPGEYQI